MRAKSTTMMASVKASNKGIAATNLLLCYGPTHPSTKCGKFLSYESFRCFFIGLLL